MIGYNYIENLFREILKLSSSIQGRFHVLHQYGLQEINADRLGQVLKDENIPDIKYPLAAIAPPHSRGEYDPDKSNEWERYLITIFFVKNSYNTSTGAVAYKNLKTGTSQHSVQDDWHDMKRAAVGFMKVLKQQQKLTKGLIFRIPPNQVLTVPISEVSSDRISGVRLTFDFDLWVDCSLTDYESYPGLIPVPLDTHPEHEM